MAFRRSSRLNKSSIISLVSRKGASMKSPFFRIKFLPARFGNTRIAIITAKKVEKSAVGRNKIRRRISACFEQTLNINSKKNFLITIFPTAKLLSKNYSYIQLQNEVNTVIQKIENFIFTSKKNNKHTNNNKK